VKTSHITLALLLFGLYTQSLFSQHNDKQELLNAEKLLKTLQFDVHYITEELKQSENDPISHIILKSKQQTNTLNQKSINQSPLINTFKKKILKNDSLKNDALTLSFENQLWKTIPQNVLVKKLFYDSATGKLTIKIGKNSKLSCREKIRNICGAHSTTIIERANSTIYQWQVSGHNYLKHSFGKNSKYYSLKCLSDIFSRIKNQMPLSLHDKYALFPISKDNSLYANDNYILYLGQDKDLIKENLCKISNLDINTWTFNKKKINEIAQNINSLSDVSLVRHIPDTPLLSIKLKKKNHTLAPLFGNEKILVKAAHLLQKMCHSGPSMKQ
jgi:hypothetical protein